MIDVAEVLKQSSITNALSSLADIAEALADGNTGYAEALADLLKGELLTHDDATRAEVLAHVQTWIRVNANGQAASICSLMGLPAEIEIETPAADLRDSLIADCLAQAESAEGVKRDELIQSAVNSLVQMGRLAVARWRKEFYRLGVDRKTFEGLLADARNRAPIVENGDAPGAETEERKEWASVKSGRLYWLDDPIGNFTATITHELIVDDGQNAPTVRYTVDGRLATGEGLGQLEIPADEFGGMNWLAKSWGARPILYVSPAKAWLVRRAIQEISLPTMKRERVHTYTGWSTVNGQRAYLTASGAITAEGFDPNVRVDLGSNTLRMYSLPIPPDDPRAAVQASLGFLNLAPLHVSLPLWAAMYAAPLAPLHSLNAVLWIYGTTQSRKSTLAMLALTHFGQGFVKGRDYKAPKDWISTITDLEGAMFAAKDLPLVIDDFAPQFTGQNDIRAMHHKAHAVVRSVGNRSARGRANADLSERMQRPPRGVVIATAELPLAGQSIVGRMIYVPVEPGEVKVSEDGNGLLDHAQAAAGATGPGLYAQSMAAYVRWLARHWEVMAETLAAEYEAANQFARKQFPSTQSRLMDYYAVMLIGARSGLRFALRCGAITQAQHDAWAKEKFPAALVDLLSRQSERVGQQSPVKKFIEALADLLAQGKCYLAPRVGEEQTPPGPGAVLVGWYEDSPPLVYLLTNACLQLARDYWQKVGEPMDILPDALRRELDQGHLIARKDDKGKQYECKLWMGKAYGNRRALVIDSDKAEELTGVSLWPDKALKFQTTGRESDE